MSNEKLNPMEVSSFFINFDISATHFRLSAILSVSCWLIVCDKISSNNSIITVSVSSIAIVEGFKLYFSAVCKYIKA